MAIHSSSSQTLEVGMSRHELGRGHLPTVYAWAAGVAVAGLVLAMLLHPTFGLYVVEGVALVAALASVGLVVFAQLVPREIPVRRWTGPTVSTFALVAFTAVALTLPFDVMALADDGIRGLSNNLARSVVLHSGEFHTAILRGVGLLVVEAGMRWKNKAAPWISLVGAALIVASFALFGHVRTYSPRIAVIATVIAHVAAAATWFGGLIGLGVSLRHSRADLATSGRLLATFARTMEVALALLLAAGVGLAILYLPSPGALINTAYGEVLLVKLAVLGAVLILSTANHFRLVDMARRGNATAVRVLRTNIAIEQIGLLAILAITAVLMRQDPRA